MSGPDRLLTVGEVADLLRVPVSWVRGHTRTNTIPHLRLGRYIRYERASVLAWLADSQQGGGPRYTKHRPRRADR